MYVAPFWTLPRVIGSAIEQTWLYMAPRSHASLMVIIASGMSCSALPMPAYLTIGH